MAALSERVGLQRGWFAEWVGWPNSGVSEMRSPAFFARASVRSQPPCVHLRRLAHPFPSTGRAASQCTEADGFAGVYPEHKFKIVEALQSKGQLIGMTGE